jgi:SAM-dependent methyltransferase
MDGSMRPRRVSGYERRIARYGPELAIALMKVAAVRAGQRALDVGCGSGALTEPLSEWLGPQNVAAVDPDMVAVEACRGRLPGLDVRVAAAEALPFADDEFDVVLAQLVVSFMSDPQRGVGEMRRVARSGGTVATSVWDFAGGMTLLRTFWDAATALDRLWRSAGLVDVTTGELRAGASYVDFEDLWVPLVAPDGSPGAYFGELESSHREALRQEVWRRLGSPAGSFRLTARAWYVGGRA